ncbi:ThiF family adenylyltransferase [Virgibacillus siamensis]|uniref:ThiF family adenylyltransferase n=1 Tax=Virgibacillus siamensis TaxID=480071 RepID=UPI0009861207|nr:ThiF family adenylyltransferase [Virgibacillus siamensis]
MDAMRYSRQMLFAPINEQGQQKLTDSSVLVVGAGALGTVICNHLVRAGIGKIRLIDRDYVELSNLQRQMLFDEDDVRKALPKAIAATQKLKKMNSEVEMEAIVGNVTNENVEELMKDIDIVMDGTDNFATRFLLNDACFKLKVPFSYGGVVSSRGMTAFFIPGKTLCLRCMVQESAGNGQTCDTVGVIGPVVDIISSLQVTEAMKYMTGNEEHLRNSLKTMDIWFNQTYDIKFTDPNPACPTCVKKDFPALTKSAKNMETTLCGRNTVQIHQNKEMDLELWEQRLSGVSEAKRTPFLLKADFRNGLKLVIFPDGRVLVQGTEDSVKARTIYDRYIGS